MDKKLTILAKISGIILLSALLSSCGQEVRPKKEASSLSAQQSQTQNGSTENSVCPYVYQPVCARPPMPECPEGRLCAQVMPQPKTYNNDCERKKDDAQFISEGQCPNYTL